MYLLNQYFKHSQMLYLVRKLNESIIINNNIEVKVVEIKRNAVKLGITFPSSATVLRKEIHDRITEENMKASGLSDFENVEIEVPLNSSEDK